MSHRIVAKIVMDKIAHQDILLLFNLYVLVRDLLLDFLIKLNHPLLEQLLLFLL